jgi:hypothetical protein
MEFSLVHILCNTLQYAQAMSSFFDLDLSR